MTTASKLDSVPKKVDLTKLPTASECQSCGLSYCDCEVCDGSNTVQVEPVTPEEAE